ncbi:tRNA (adenosine(37)-N6)-threonylcarbamoyltransferase complex dimerization subunit type 1 TsaB [soil metagenome]
MLILGIETATMAVGCASGGHEGILASFHAARGRRHVETLAPAIEFTCRQSRIELSEISVVAVDIGPGRFSGLRVGVATAKAMASALRIPVVGVESLDLLAFPVRWSDRLIASVVDARRGEVFSAFYRQVPGGVQRLSEPRVGAIGELTAELLAIGEECLAVGDGALRWADELRALNTVEVADPGLAHPSAASLVQLAHARALREEFVNPWEVAPVYLRKADAEINWAVRESAGSS